MDWEAESNKSAREDLLQSRFAVQYEARWIGSAMPMERVAMNRVDHCGCMGAIWITRGRFIGTVAVRFGAWTCGDKDGMM